MELKVIVDTNSIRNERHNSFLGGRKELNLFLKFADIIIPEMVIEEIQIHKKKYLKSEQKTFLSNAFHSLMELDETVTQEFDINSFINELKNNEDIPYTPIRLTNYQVIEEMKELTLDNRAPFDTETDKGFKDAYIYFTILEYLKSIEDKQVFFLTKDAKLQEAFENEKRVIPVKDYKEFFKYTNEYFANEYFFGQLRDRIRETEGNVTIVAITNKHLNQNDDWVLEIGLPENKIYNVIADFNSKEIMDITSFNFSEEIKTLVNSDSFQQTHTCIENIKDYIDYFSIDEIEDLIKAEKANDQIRWIRDDPDVKKFFQSIRPTPENDD